MNRLNFGMKFTLTSVIIFLPMIITNYFLVNEAYHQFKVTRTELRSLDVLDGALKVGVGVLELRDLKTVNSFTGQSGSGEQIEARMQGLMNDLEKDIKKLEMQSDDLDLSEEFAKKRGELLQALDAVRSETSLGSAAELAQKLLNNYQLFFKFTAVSAGLAQDADRTVRQLSDLLVNTTPIIVEALGRGRATGSYALERGFLDSATSTEMDNLFLELEKRRNEYQLKIDEALDGSARVQTQLAGATTDSVDSLKSAGTVFEDKIIMADALDMPWDQYFQALTVEMNKTYALNGAIIELLGQELSERLDDNQQQMGLMVLALVGIFASIVYLYAAFYVSTRGSLHALGGVMSRMSAGDMTVKFKVVSQDELGELGVAVNNAVEKMHDLIQKVGETVEKVDGQAGQVRNISAESSQAVNEQRSQIELVATAMNQMAATAQEVARSASVAVDSAHKVNQETSNGRTQVNSQISNIERLANEIDNSVQVINKLAGDSQAISQVLDVIKGIAEQTNLLALNAAIEAARAGEQGRGFAVVADEVRNLAKRTQQSTEEIEEMIARLQSGVGAAVKAMGTSHKMANDTVSESSKVQQALDNILGAAGYIVDQSQQIAAAAEEQTAVAQDIDRNIVQISEAGERTAQGANKAESASTQLNELVHQLKRLTANFRV
nr:methyl-accepting chemotaxis protein [Atopomonas sediminilitoris]